MNFLRPALFSAVSFLTITACAHVSPDSRAPSSIHIIGMSATLEDILASVDPRSEARAYVSRLLIVELRGHAWMYETDRIFAGASAPVNLFHQPAYRKLLVAHPIMERMQAKIVEFYKRAHEVTLDNSRSEEDRANAALVVAGVHDAILHAHQNPAERVLLNDLLRALKEARHKTRQGFVEEAMASPFEDEELSAAAAGASARIREMISALPEADEVKAEIEDAEKVFAQELLEGDREPQSLSIYPSVSANGNIDGFTFPKSTWAITFDDGPHLEYTEENLANLVASGTKATFFWLAKNVAVLPDIVKKVQDAGMPVENHSWTHPKLNDPLDLARLKTNLDKEINQSTALDFKVYGEKPRFFRCPYGAGFKDPMIRSMIAKQGMIHVRWNVDSLDWKDPDPASVQARVEQQMAVNGRGIILFHDIHAPGVTVSKALISKYKGKMRWVSIPQIVDELNGVVLPPRQPQGDSSHQPRH